MVELQDIALIGTCHSCRLRETADCTRPKRAEKRPELGCTLWQREQIALPWDDEEVING